MTNTINPEALCRLQMAYQAARALVRIGTMAAYAKAKALDADRQSDD